MIWFEGFFMYELKEELKDFIDIKITSLPAFYDLPEAHEKRLELLDHACKNGLIDYKQNHVQIMKITTIIKFLIMIILKVLQKKI